MENWRGQRKNYGIQKEDYRNINGEIRGNTQEHKRKTGK